MKEKDELIQKLNDELALDLPSAIGLDEIRHHLAAHIHELINENFQKLIAILYRVDISEARLRAMLQDYPGQDAGIIIADLILERQLQKIKSRRENSKRDNNIDENEKW